MDSILIPAEEVRHAWTYCFLSIWGLIVFFLFWNGSIGWSDRSYWSELQSAAHTKF